VAPWGPHRQSIIKVWIAERLERGTSSPCRLACPTVPDCVSGLMTVLRKIQDAKVESPLRADAPRLPDPQSCQRPRQPSLPSADVAVAAGAAAGLPPPLTRKLCAPRKFRTCGACFLSAVRGISVLIREPGGAGGPAGQPGRPLKVTMQKCSHPCASLSRAYGPIGSVHISKRPPAKICTSFGTRLTWLNLR
jgi:hypothetical protein